MNEAKNQAKSEESMNQVPLQAQLIRLRNEATRCLRTGDLIGAGMVINESFEIERQLLAEKIDRVNKDLNKLKEF